LVYEKTVLDEYFHNGKFARSAALSVISEIVYFEFVIILIQQNEI